MINIYKRSLHFSSVYNGGNSFPSQVPPILYGNIRLQQVFEHKHLGLISHPIYLGQNIYLQSLIKPTEVLVLSTRTNISYLENRLENWLLFICTTNCRMHFRINNTK